MTKRLLPPFCAAALAAGLIIFPRECSFEVSSSLSFCVKTLFPSLFPFFVLTSFVSRSGAARALSRAFARPVKALFFLPGACAASFIGGVLGGCPVCALSCRENIKSGLCSKKEASYAAALSPGAGIAFMLGVCPSLFGSFKLCLLLFLSHLFSCLLCGLVFGFYLKRKGRENAPPPNLEAPLNAPLKKPLPFSASLSGALKDALPAVAGVCSCVIFFSVLFRLLCLSGVQGAFTRLVSVFSRGSVFPLFSESLFSGFLEMSRGINALSALNARPASVFTCAAATIGFGGLSVHFQTAGILEEGGVSPRPFFLSRVLISVLSALSFRFIFFLLFGAL